MATATVQVNVQRRIQLTLRAPALAAVTTATVAIGTSPLPVTISGKTVTTTFDYRDDDLLFRADIGQSERLTLVSALGNGLELASRTPPSGQLSADQWAALEVSPFTTSLAGTLGGLGLPTSSAEYDARLRALTDWEGVTRRANYLAAIVAGGEAALPAPLPLYFFASDPIGTDLLIEDTTLSAGPRNALFPASALGAVAGGAGTVWFYRGGTNVDESAFKLELAAGGTGTLVGPYGAKAVSWNNQQNALNVTPAGPQGEPPTLLSTGLVTRRGGACEFNVPKLFQRADRVVVQSLKLAGLAYSAPSASATPDAWIASVTGQKLKGFSLSGCQPLFEDADPGPSFPYDVRSGAPATVAALALGAGRWLLPFFGDAGNGRPLPQTAVDVSAGGGGVGPGGLAFSSQAQADGSLVLSYPGTGTLRLYAIAKFGNGYRVLVETARASGERQLDEAWFARFDDQSNFGNRLKGVRLRGCCRFAALRILRFDAQGQAFWELTSGGFVVADATVAPPRGTLTARFSEDDGVVIDPVVPYDGRFLTYSKRIGAETGSAEIVTLEPATPPTP
jgi:hypothetical protein